MVLPKKNCGEKAEKAAKQYVGKQVKPITQKTMSSKGRGEPGLIFLGTDHAKKREEPRRRRVGLRGAKKGGTIDRKKKGFSAYQTGHP